MPATTSSQTSVTCPLTGHVWTFSKAVTVGQYWNGEWFAVEDASATITGVTPNGTTDAGGLDIHGLMKNPFQGDGNGTAQGFDERPADGQNTPRGLIAYSAALNIDPTASGTPITLTEGSYVKAESRATITSDTRIEEFSVLTVVTSVPEANAFRPGIRSTTKTSLGTTADVDWTLRRNITAFTPMADPTADVAKIKTLQWTWAALQENQRGYFPASGIDVYGAGWGDTLYPRMLAFHGEYSQAQLEEVTHSIIQIGIDLLAGVLDGMTWVNEEGHHIFRKFPVLMAGLLLNNSTLINAADWNQNPSYFGNDDNSYYYITQSLINESPTPNSKTSYPIPYPQEMLGKAEWGAAVETASSDGIATPDLKASYRVLNNLRVMEGAAWCFATTGAEARCNPAMLDYYDRIAEILHGDYTDALYSTETDPPFTGNWGSTPFGSARLSRYETLRAFSARARYVSVPEEMPAPALTVETDGTLTVNFNATNDFRSPRNATSAITQYDLRWRPVTNITGTTTPDASIPWRVVEDVTIPYVLSGLPGNTDVRVQLRMHNGEGPGVWFDPSPWLRAGGVETRYAATATTHNASTAPQGLVSPAVQLPVPGASEVARCDPGIWASNPSPCAFAYQWQRDTMNIAGATSQTYTTQVADEGTSLRCVVTATNSAGSTPVNTAAVSVSASPPVTYSPMALTRLAPAWAWSTKVKHLADHSQVSAGIINALGGARLVHHSDRGRLAYVDDVEVYMEWEQESTDSIDAKLILRGSGVDTTAAGYLVGYTRNSSASTTDLEIESVSAGVRTVLQEPAASIIAVDTRWSLRAQATGTTIRARIWQTSLTEPETWGVTATDATHTAGWIGLFSDRSEWVERIYKLTVGLNGTAAPTTLTDSLNPPRPIFNPATGQIVVTVA